MAEKEQTKIEYYNWLDAKFKIGDTVRVIGSSRWNKHDGHIGKVGKVIAIRVGKESFPTLYRLDFMDEEPPSNVYRIENKDLELVE